MPRPLSAEMLAALQAPVIKPAIFVEITFASATAYIWSGIGSVEWNGHTWLGLGARLRCALLGVNVWGGSPPWTRK
jgi:hypothetical protein